MTSTDTSTVSVIVPVYNDPVGIETTLGSLCEQTYPREAHEILVVDNGSTDRTRDVVRAFRDRNPDVVELLVEDERQGSYAARNRGIRRASGSILAFIDADMRVEEEWLYSVVEAMRATGCEYMGCDVEVYTEEGCETLVATYNQASGFPIEGFLENQQFVPTCCLVTRRRVFETVGLFDARMISGGDVEFGQRVHEADFDQWFNPDITMFHPARSSLRSLLAKKFRVGRGLVQYDRYHSERFENRIWKKLGSYVPPHPLRFRRRMRQADVPTEVWTFVLLYCIAYLDTLARTAGAWYEFIFGKP